MKAYGIAQRVGCGVNLGAQAASAVSDGSVRLPFTRSSSVLMRTHDTKINHGVVVVGIRGQVSAKLVPYIAFGLSPQSYLNDLPSRKSLDFHLRS